IGVIFGPKSDPITFAYTSASRITPVVSVSAIAIASIITVGILLIIEDSIAAIKPIAMVAKNRPCSELASITRANTSVSPAFLKLNTITYLPIEKNTISHGALLIPALVSSSSLFFAFTRIKIAAIPATIETGMFINSPKNNRLIILQELTMKGGIVSNPL